MGTTEIVCLNLFCKFDVITRSLLAVLIERLFRTENPAVFTFKKVENFSRNVNDKRFRQKLKNLRKFFYVNISRFPENLKRFREIKGRAVVTYGDL